MTVLPSKSYICKNAFKIDNLSILPEKILSIFERYKIILIGEIHGTNEGPKFCAGLIKLLAKSKIPILLVLEINEEEQSIFDCFLQSGDASVFKKSKLFNDPIQYGISSQALVDLLSLIREINDIKVLCSLPKNYVDNDFSIEKQEQRDQAWALDPDCYQNLQPKSLVWFRCVGLI
jgi:hypothetical protein